MRLPYLLLFFTALSLAQNQYPQDYFRSPMDLPVHPSGTFGELRNNHFHSGLDFRTKQKEGFPVYAAAEGYVSRIKVSAYGYGLALYIDHPNGYTTVYGHLLKYAPKIDDFIRDKQYKKQSFEIDQMLKPGEIIVQKGELIAYSGNSGGSGGPHLHFEYRDTKTEAIINPLLFGLSQSMTDTIAPFIHGIMVYPLSDDAVINQARKPYLVSLRHTPEGTYLVDKIRAKGKIGLAIYATDKSAGSMSNNGIYKVETFCNGTPSFGYTFDTFAFNESRYVNYFIDYSHYYSTGLRFQKLFVKNPYNLSIIKSNKSNGQFDIKPGNVQNFKIEVSDFHQNKAVIYGSVEYSDEPATVTEPRKITPYYVRAGYDHNYTNNNVSVFIPANAFYEDFYLDFKVKDSILQLHYPTVPVHTYVELSFDVAHLPAPVLQKTFIAGVTDKKIFYNESRLEEGRLVAKVKTLGEYKLAQDTVAPKIYAPDFKEGKWLSKKDTFSVRISDELSGIATFDAWLNGKWALMHYDYKKKTIHHNFSDGIVAEGKNELKIMVTDNVGNSATFDTHFFRTQNTPPVEND
ncbi:peptidase M23 [Flavobacterium cyanobacteriorum]|uniref:Peptidase M23 n=1 Tax=Flavobacterium cyanobacteriorum TaxID=2022802 RepID=A0A255ZAG2_9FLAO|nr:M23 family metallopeptidase [Flavobacterium cyanobacteriorum]OYQ38401.1 peptidase M23 [Flavobacterium cyanobacteriorum]